MNRKLPAAAALLLAAVIMLSAGGRYELETSTTGGDFHSDSQGGFTGN